MYLQHIPIWTSHLSIAQESCQAGGYHTGHAGLDYTKAKSYVMWQAKEGEREEKRNHKLIPSSGQELWQSPVQAGYLQSTIKK